MRRDEFLADIRHYYDRSEELESLKETSQGSLAAIILFDQFPRNCFRGMPESFQYDQLALSLSKYAIAKGFEKEYNDFERAFLYLPFEHSESLEEQKTSEEKFSQLHSSSKEIYKTFTKMFLDYSVSHRETIERFGRFPHRNAILGRESTPEELEYLGRGGEPFGSKK